MEAQDPVEFVPITRFMGPFCLAPMAFLVFFMIFLNGLLGIFDAGVGGVGCFGLSFQIQLTVEEG